MEKVAKLVVGFGSEGEESSTQSVLDLGFPVGYISENYLSCKWPDSQLE